MTDLYFFILTAINLFVLIFMCGLVKLSETLNPKQAKGFLATFILIGGISILEMISVLAVRSFLSRRVSATPRREQTRKCMRIKRNTRRERADDEQSHYRV